MTEVIKLRPVKPVKSRRSHKRSYTFTTADTSSNSSSDDESSSNDESSFLFKLQSNSSKKSKKNNKIQTLPIIINAQSVKQKKKHHEKPIQQFLINTQPLPSPSSSSSSSKKKEITINQIIEPSFSPEIQYIPLSSSTTSLARVIENRPLVYQRAYTPTLIEESPFAFYNSYERPIRRIVRAPPPNTRSVYLPKHAKKLVNRFLNGMEHAHGCRHMDGYDSDCSIDDCQVCRRLRSAMNRKKQRSSSEVDLYHGSRVVFETQEPHKHGHSRNCKVCDLLEKSDFVISTTKHHSTTDTKKRGKHVHMVESFPSNVKPALETTTTTTTTTQPKVVVNNPPAVIPSVPIQSSYYPTSSYPTYLDPNTGITYAYDPNWPYSSTGTNFTYNYPGYMQSNPQYETYNTTVPIVTDTTNLTTQQQSQAVTTVTSNPLIDTGTYTYMPADRKKHKPVNKTVVVHTSRNLTPPAPQIIIEQPRSPRLPRKLKSTTILKERTTQTPHTTTTTYVRT